MMNDNWEERMALRRRRAVIWLFAVLIIFVMLAFFFTLMGSLLSQREKMREERCDRNLRDLYVASVEYCDAHGTYPPAFTTDEKGNKLHSWRVLLLPYLKEAELYSQIRLDEPWDSEWNRQFWTKTPNVYRCASMPVPTEDNGLAQYDRCAFSCVVGEKTAFPSDGAAIDPKNLPDGAANTILYTERKNPVNWMDPNSDITEQCALEENKLPVKERVSFASWHGNGVLVVFCGGERSLLSEKIDDDVLALLLRTNDSDGNDKEKTSEKVDEQLNEKSEEKLEKTTRE